MIPWQRLTSWLASYRTKAGGTALRNLIGLGGSTLLGQVCSALSLVLLSRSLPQEDLGQLLFGLTWQTYVLTLSVVGPAIVMVREGAKPDADRDALATSYLTIALVGTTLGAIIVGGWAWSQGQLVVLLLVVGNLFSALQLTPLFDLAHRQSLGGLVVLAGDMLALALVVILYVTGRLDLWAATGIFLLKWCINGLGQWVVYRQCVSRLRFRWQPGLAIQLFHSAWPISLMWPVAMFPITGGILFVKAWLGDAEAAGYGLASQLALAFALIVSLPSRILLPHIAGKYGCTPSFIKKLIWFEAIFTLGMTGLAFLGGWAVLVLLLPPTYADVLGPMLLLLAGAAALSPLSVFQGYLFRFGKEKILLAGYFLTASLFATLSAMLPSILGIASSSLAAMWAGTLLIIALIWWFFPDAASE